MQVTGAPELLLHVRLSATKVVVEPQVMISQMLAMVAACPSLQPCDQHQIMPLDQFLQMELEGYRKLLELVKL